MADQSIPLPRARMTEREEVALFIRASCETGPSVGSALLNDLWVAYAGWAEDRGHRPMKRTRFLDCLRRLGHGPWFDTGGWSTARMYRIRVASTGVASEPPSVEPPSPATNPLPDHREDTDR